MVITTPEIQKRLSMRYPLGLRTGSKNESAGGGGWRRGDTSAGRLWPVQGVDELGSASGFQSGEEFAQGVIEPLGLIDEDAMAGVVDADQRGARDLCRKPFPGSQVPATMRRR